MDSIKMKRIASSVFRDVPCVLCVIVFLASVTLTVSAVQEQPKGALQDDQTEAFELAKRSKDNQHKFGWGKRSRSNRVGLADEMFDKRGSDSDQYAALTGRLCNEGPNGCTYKKLRVPYSQMEEGDDFAGEGERDAEEGAGQFQRDANEDRNGWGGNYGRDLDDSPSELQALLSAKKRVYDSMAKRHGNGWNGAYGKRSRNGWHSSYGKKKRSI